MKLLPLIVIVIVGTLGTLILMVKGIIPFPTDEQAMIVISLVGILGAYDGLKSGLKKGKKTYSDLKSN